LRDRPEHIKAVSVERETRTHHSSTYSETDMYYSTVCWETDLTFQSSVCWETGLNIS